MPQSPLKVLFITAELAPFSTVGGLSQVSYFLPKALLKLGVDIRVLVPKYGIIDEKKYPLKTLISGLKIPTGEPENSAKPTELICNIKTLATEKKTEPVVYFLENREYYEMRANVYGYSDDHIRFGLLSRAAMEFLKTSDFKPDIVHANDWHTGFLINYMRTDYKDNPVFKKIASLFSVHNLHQGNFDFAHASDLDFDDGKSPLAGFFEDRFYKQNALKRGVIYADFVNTVSKTFAFEITKEEYGRGLHNLFKELRGKTFGILNGLDYNEFNPATDKLLKKNYSSGNYSARLENKKELQKEFGLDVDETKPLVCFWGRLDQQKGINLIINTIKFLLDEFDIQFVIHGPSGDENYNHFFEQLEKDYPGRVGTHLMWDSFLRHKIASGADILLHPSSYEPGGIVAMEAMRYGCVPVARATGGLADSVQNYDSAKGTGTGFTFKSFSEESFLVAVVRALELYNNKNEWKKLVKRTMETNFSWENVAKEYLDLYKRVIKFRQEFLNPGARTFKQVID